MPKGLVVLDPHASRGFRRVSYGPVVNGKPLTSPAMRRLILTLVRDQMTFAERERREAAWVERQLATAPPLTVAQSRMLRRVKTELIRLAQG